jgi:hypothetical protein
MWTWNYQATSQNNPLIQAITLNNKIYQEHLQYIPIAAFYIHLAATFTLLALVTILLIIYFQALVSSFKLYHLCATTLYALYL